jgi:hypothetical protein
MPTLEGKPGFLVALGRTQKCYFTDTDSNFSGKSAQQACQK